MLSEYIRNYKIWEWNLGEPPKYCYFKELDDVIFYILRWMDLSNTYDLKYMHLHMFSDECLRDGYGWF